jgi:Arc/MetJ-type ribon-helix-helix transcriptional regulator
MPDQIVKELDQWVEEGKFKSRSDAVKTILALYEERVKTMEFFKMLAKRSKDYDDNPKTFIPIDDIDV